jgi:MOSC domain-containing protein YiiM
VSDEHRVLRLWTRPEKAGAMVEHDSLELVEGQGVEGDHTFGRMRHVTIVFEDDWKQAEAALGRQVDPAGRRANVFVAGGNGQRYVGGKIRLGGALVEIKQIVAPCPVMEQAAEGLQEALGPDGRGGIWGRVLESTTLQVGDTLSASAT